MEHTSRHHQVIPASARCLFQVGFSLKQRNNEEGIDTTGVTRGRLEKILPEATRRKKTGLWLHKSARTLHYLHVRVKHTWLVKLAKNISDGSRTIKEVLAFVDELEFS